MGTGYAITPEYPNLPILCPDCEGKGVLILTAEMWDIELEAVPSGIISNDTSSNMEVTT
jgi:hypothetical protein